jgi:hypothetical protein
VTADDICGIILVSGTVLAGLMFAYGVFIKGER